VTHWFFTAENSCGGQQKPESTATGIGKKIKMRVP
jgi:hypothetical protein